MQGDMISSKNAWEWTGRDIAHVDQMSDGHLRPIAKYSILQVHMTSTGVHTQGSTCALSTNTRENSKFER